MKKNEILSARERQIMDVIYSLEEATATQVLEHLPDPPSRNSVRTFLRILEEKGHLKHRLEGREYVFRPVKSRDREGQRAIQQVLKTFFDGSLEKAIAVHLTGSKSNVSEEELKRLESLIRNARRQGD